MASTSKESSASATADEVAPAKNSKDEPASRKSMCRYGPGCTHIMDPSHREKFWHPRIQKLNDEQIKSHFICNECGYATNSLPDLQLHLQRKTAWSNQSLVGCRINCLVDMKEWHEGLVTQYHKSGKHFVEFRLLQERRWLIMKKVTFYIIERPAVHNDGSEFKDSGDHEINLAPIEDSWVFCEDITVDYAFAQSVLFKIYGNNLQETGHLTRGHVCVTDSDRVQAQHAKSSLLYGELLPRGANKAFGNKRLEADCAETLFDLGMGTGKILLQAFLQFRNLRYIYGVELSVGRYQLAEEAVLRMVELLGHENYHIHSSPGKFIMVTEAVKLASSLDENVLNGREEEEYMERVLHFQCGNMFDLKEIDLADIVMMETDIPIDLYPNLQNLLLQMKDDARILTYFDMRRVFEFGDSPFRQLEINKNLSDRYPTSWSVQRGHHFFIWNKQPLPERTSMSTWPFSSMITSDVPELSFEASHQSPNHYNNHHSAASSPSYGKNGHHNSATHHSGKGDLSVGYASTDASSSSRCLPFGLRYLFYSSSPNKQPSTMSSPSSRHSPSIPPSSPVPTSIAEAPSSPSQSEVVATSPSKEKETEKVKHASANNNHSPSKKAMRYVGDDVNTRDRSVSAASSPLRGMSSTTPSSGKDFSTSDQQHDNATNEPWSETSSPRCSPRNASSDAPMLCLPNTTESSTTISANSPPAKSSKRSEGRKHPKRSESPRVRKTPSGKQQLKQNQSANSTPRSSDVVASVSGVGVSVTTSQSSSVVIDNQPTDLLLPFPSLPLSSTTAQQFDTSADHLGPQPSLFGDDHQQYVPDYSAGLDFSQDIRSRLRASPLMSDLNSPSAVSSGSPLHHPNTAANTGNTGVILGNGSYKSPRNSSTGHTAHSIHSSSKLYRQASSATPRDWLADDEELDSCDASPSLSPAAGRGHSSRRSQPVVIAAAGETGSQRWEDEPAAVAATANHNTGKTSRKHGRSGGSAVSPQSAQRSSPRTVSSYPRDSSGPNVSQQYAGQEDSSAQFLGVVVSAKDHVAGSNSPHNTSGSVAQSQHQKSSPRQRSVANGSDGAATGASNGHSSSSSSSSNNGGVSSSSKKQHKERRGNSHVAVAVAVAAPSYPSSDQDHSTPAGGPVRESSNHIVYQDRTAASSCDVSMSNVTAATDGPAGASTGPVSPAAATTGPPRSQHQHESHHHLSASSSAQSPVASQHHASTHPGSTPSSSSSQGRHRRRDDDSNCIVS